MTDVRHVDHLEGFDIDHTWTVRKCRWTNYGPSDMSFWVLAKDEAGALNCAEWHMKWLFKQLGIELADPPVGDVVPPPPDFIN
jgi:hypothetical protein